MPEYHDEWDQPHVVALLPDPRRGVQGKFCNGFWVFESRAQSRNCPGLKQALAKLAVSDRIICSLAAQSLTGKADLDQDTRLFHVYDHRLIRAHIHELVFDLFLWLQRELLVFAHFELPAPAPGINESGHRLR